jgi:CTP synthase
VIEYARNVLKLKGANSTEFDPKSVHPVINMMEEQKKIIDKGATMRLGSYECALTPGTLAHKAYGGQRARAAPPPLRGQQRLRRPVATRLA